MHAAEFRIEKRTFEVDAETACAVGLILFEIVCGVDHFGCDVQHRFKRRRHHACDEAGRAHARVLGRRHRHGVTLIAIEEHVARAVGVNVDQARSDAAARGKRIIRGAVGAQDRRDATVLYDNAADGRCSVSDGEKSRT